jgi:hypothetical protein
MLTSSRILLFILFLIVTPLVISAEKDEQKPSPGLNEATLKGLEWRSIGPALTAGRIADIAINHKNRST